MKTKEIIRHVFFNGRDFKLTPAFFSANVYIMFGAKCKNCPKKGLKKDERVDVEFFGGDIESYCLDCWGKVILDKAWQDEKEKRIKPRNRAHYL